MTTLPLRRRRELDELLRDTFALFGQNWRALLAVTAVVVIPIEIVVYGIGLGWITARYSDPTQTESLLETGVGWFLEGPLATAMVIAVILQLEAGRGTSVREGMQRGFELFVPLLVVSLLYALAVLVPAATLLLIPLAIVTLVRFALAVPMLVVEEGTPMEALARSWALTAGAFWRTLGRLCAMVLVLVLPGAVAGALFTALARAADALAVSLAGGILVSLFAVPLAAIFVLLLSFDLAAAAERAPTDD